VLLRLAKHPQKDYIDGAPSLESDTTEGRARASKRCEVNARAEPDRVGLLLSSLEAIHRPPAGRCYADFLRSGNWSAVASGEVDITRPGFLSPGTSGAKWKVVSHD
jgi:hypothetical protein